MDLDESHEGGSITSSSGINFSECALKEPPVALAVADAWRAMKPHFEETRRAANYTPAELAAAATAAAAAAASATTATAGTTSRLGFGSGLATSVVPAAATVAAVEVAPQDDAKAVKQQLREDVARSLSPLRDSDRNATVTAAVHSNGSNGKSVSRSRDRDGGGGHNGFQRSHSRSSQRRYDEQHQQYTATDRHSDMHAGDHHYSGEQYNDGSRYRSEGAYNAAYEREISGRKHERNSDERREAVYYDDHAVHDDMHSDSHYGYSSDRHYADYNSNEQQHYEHSAYEHNSVHSSGSKSSKRRHKHRDSRSDRYADDHHHQQQQHQQLSREAMLAADAAKRAAEAQYDEDVRRARLARQEQQRLRENGESREIAYSPLNDNGGVSSHTIRGRSRSHESSRHSGSSSKRKRHGHSERSSERSREVVGVDSSGWGNGNGDHHNSSYDVYNGGYDESGHYSTVDTLQQQQQQQQYYEQESSRHSHSSSSKRARSRSRDRSGHRSSSSRRRSSEHKHKHSSSSSGSVLQDAAAVATANAIAIAQKVSADIKAKTASAANASVNTTAGDTIAGSRYAPAAVTTTTATKPEIKCAQDATSATEFLAAIQAQKAASKTSAATSSSNSRVTPPKVPQFDSSTNSLAASSTQLLQQPPVFSSATNTLDSKSLSVNTTSFTTGVTGATDRRGPGSSGSEGDSPTKYVL
jgi:hypothetical protein